MSREIVTQDGEVVEPGSALALPDGYSSGNQPLAIALARAEVDQQITTAHAYPRNPKRAMSAILNLATLDEETAEECVYALPRGKKAIKGPSIRLAEIIAGQWGNARIGTRLVHIDRVEKYVEAEGIFHDLETNVATTARVRRRISGQGGQVFSDDMIVQTGNAACAIAKRNAILGGVPKAVWRKAYAAVEAVIAGDVKTLSERREKAMKAFAAFGVTPDQVFSALAIDDIEGVTVEHLTTLMGMHAALKSGEASVEEMFPKAPAKGDAPKGTKAKLDNLAIGGKDDGDVLAGRAEEILRDLDHAPKGIDTGEPAQVIAYAAGIDAAAAGAERRAIPGGLREKNRDAEAKAWQLGHDFATAQADQGEVD